MNPLPIQLFFPFIDPDPPRQELLPFMKPIRSVSQLDIYAVDNGGGSCQCRNCEQLLMIDALFKIADREEVYCPGCDSKLEVGIAVDCLAGVGGSDF